MHITLSSEQSTNLAAQEWVLTLIVAKSITSSLVIAWVFAMETQPGVVPSKVADANSEKRLIIAYLLVCFGKRATRS